MDHRGTGRSTLLECPDDDDGEPQTEDEIVECFRYIKDEFGHDAPMAFSVTSAATDLKVLVQSSMFAQADVYVYGVSYGTYLVERLMHLQPSNVKGYILDSIQSEQFYTDKKDAPYYSNWDRDVGQVVEGFFALCDNDAFCNAKIGPKSRQTLHKAYLALDAGETECFDILYRVAHDGGYAKPSGLVGQTLYEWLVDSDRRVFIPAYIYRLARCNPDDQDWLTQLNYPPPLDDLPEEGPYLRGPGFSDIVYNNIVFAEIWQSSHPSSPSAQRLYQDSVDALLSLGNVVYARNRAILYCLYRQNADPMCADYPRYDESFTYNQDDFWNRTATVPPGASVLMFAGGLDPATPLKYARDEYTTMVGDAKLLLEFPAANHGVLVNSPDRDDSHVSCGAVVLSSYMAHGGDVSQVDLSCMARVEPLRFSHWDRDLAFDLFGSENPYNESAVQVKVLATIQAKFMMAVGVLCGLLVVAVVGLLLLVRQNLTLRRRVAALTTPSKLDAIHETNTETHPLTAADSPSDATDVLETTHQLPPPPPPRRDIVDNV
ncbi:hypothetical protein, variant [Aphanomyces invadans]|nr:hypothetical protein, variant [Aphanomyces invadans]ETW05817.1 hypothetical protein, variant [Aphanomyces invadans]|eukprot:XP_008865594.1 hypothetical protein, variant [Aphanomyces invadans]